MKQKKKDNNIIQKKEISENDKLLSNNNNQLTVVSSQGYEVVSTTLPNNFYEGLLIREMELNNEFTIEKLLDLVRQYSLAIEFYLQIDPLKSKDYQNRMEYLLTNKDTLIQLSKYKIGKPDENNEKSQNQKIKNNKEFKQSKHYIKLKQEDINNEDISEKVNSVINKGKKDENKNVQNLINDDIKKQNESWKEKFNSKRKVSLRNSCRTSLRASLTKKKLSLDNSKDFGGSKSKDSSKNNESEDNLIKINEEENKLGENHENFDNIEEIKEENIEEEKKEVDKKEEEKKDDKKEEEKKEDKKEEIKQENEKEEKKEDNKKENKEEDNKEKKEDIENKENKNENNNEDIESIIYNILKEQEEEDEEIEKKKKEEKLKKENSKNENKIIEEKTENKINDNLDIKDIPPTMNRASIVDEDMTRKIEPDEEISKSIEEQIQSLKKIISKFSKFKNQIENDKENEEEEEDSQNEESNKNSEYSNSNTNLNKVSKNDSEHGLLYSNLDDIPAKFMSTYYQIESFMIEYMNNFNEFFYHDVFEQFSSGLKELYESKYNKYIEIRNEYHNQIKENEYLLENDDNLNEEKKLEIQQTIDSLNEEQQHQIDTIEDEFNRKIIEKISEFKLNSFKNNSGIQLLEEQLKLNIYSLINDSFLS